MNAATWAAGQEGYGITTTGYPTSVNLAASETLAIGNAFTVEAWIRPTARTQGWVWSQRPLSTDNKLYVMAWQAMGL